MKGTVLSEERLAAANQLLAAAGFERPLAFSLLNGGANNQVYRVHLLHGSVLLKAYFWHPDDPRDRLGADFGFSWLAWQNGARALPQPFFCDKQNHLGLFEFLFGAKLNPGEVSQAAVQAALDFFLKVNSLRGQPAATRLAAGSEACFSLQDHLHCVHRRIERLRMLPGQSSLDREAAAFVTGQLIPRSTQVLADALDQAANLGIAWQQPIPENDRCLSPSDFGFHNTLRLGDGTIRFFDFEYAGWDDPGKLVADFFCQPACPVPIDFFESFAKTVAHETSDPELNMARFRLLLPVYRLKWCCIMLNDFLPSGNQRRTFAHRHVDEKARKRQQLLKARQALLNLYPLGAWGHAA